jgi:hypothetical protein
MEDDGRDTVEVNEVTGEVNVAIRGLKGMSATTRSIVTHQDLQDLQLAVVTDPMISRAQFDPAIAPEVINNSMIPAIIQSKFPGLDDEGVDEVREQLVAQRAVTAIFREAMGGDAGGSALIEGAKRLHVKDLHIDLIDSVNPAEGRLEILSKTFDAKLLDQVQAAISARRPNISEEEVESLIPRLKRFCAEHGYPPSASSQDPIEKRLYDAVAYLRNVQSSKSTENL